MACGRNFFILLFPLLGTAAALVLTIVMMLGSTEQASALHDVYYLKVDFSNITTQAVIGTQSDSLDSAAQSIINQLGVSNFYTTGISGFCRGDERGKYHDCETPMLPYWFDLFGILRQDTNTENLNIDLPEDVQKYEKVLRTASKVMWVFYIIAAGLLVIELVIGLCTFRSRIMSCCTAFVSFFATAFMVVASGLGTGIHVVYRKYFNQEVNQFGISAEIGKTMLGLTWAASGLCLWAFVWWLFSICCGNTKRSSRNRDMEETRPFIPNRRW